MSALERLPDWATTGVGSLPHTDVEDAVAHVSRGLRRPVLPATAAAGRRHDHRVARGRSGPLRVVARARSRAPAGLERAARAARAPAAGARRREAAGHRAGHVGATRSGTTRWPTRSRPGSRRTSPSRCARSTAFDVLLMVDEPALHLTDAAERVWDPLRASRRCGACTCAARCRGTRSRAPSPTCCPSTSRSPRRRARARSPGCARRADRLGRRAAASARARAARAGAAGGAARRRLLVAADAVVRQRADVAPPRVRGRDRAVGHRLRTPARERDEVAARPRASDC